MRLFVSRPEERQALSMYGWDKPVQKSQAKNGWKVHCNIYQAQDIVAGDATGLSDAYLNVYFNGTELSTSVINDTVNPVCFIIITPLIICFLDLERKIRIWSLFRHCR